MERVERRFWIALMLYGTLGAVVWFTLGPGTIRVLGRAVDIRAIPMFVIATFVFRTWIARSAERIRRKDAGQQLNFSLTIAHCPLLLGGSNSVVESQPSKLLVASSILVSRSMIWN